MLRMEKARQILEKKHYLGGELEPQTDYYTMKMRKKEHA